MINYTERQKQNLAEAFNKTKLTINRWVKSNDDRLTSNKAIEVINRTAVATPKVFQKNKVYSIRDKKYLCILKDKEYACLAPIVPHRKDSGYGVKFKTDVYHPVIAENKIEAELVALVSNKIYRPLI